MLAKLKPLKAPAAGAVGAAAGALAAALAAPEPNEKPAGAEGVDDRVFDGVAAI